MQAHAGTLLQDPSSRLAAAGQDEESGAATEDGDFRKGTPSEQKELCSIVAKSAVFPAARSLALHHKYQCKQSLQARCKQPPYPYLSQDTGVGLHDHSALVSEYPRQGTPSLDGRFCFSLCVYWRNARPTAGFGSIPFRGQGRFKSVHGRSFPAARGRSQYIALSRMVSYSCQQDGATQAFSMITPES